MESSGGAEGSATIVETEAQVTAVVREAVRMDSLAAWTLPW